MLEQLRVIPYVWARSDTETYTDIRQRTNELAEFLPGRSMGTFGHPILLGTFAAVALILSIVIVTSSRRWTYLFIAALAASTILMSGTRSAAAAATVAITCLIVFQKGRFLLLRLLVGGTLAVLLLFYEQIIASVFNAEVIESVSFTHRSRILSSLPALLDRNDFAFIFGSGAGSIDQLFSDGIVSGYGTFRFFDNQYVRLVALSGIVGLMLFAIAAVRALWKGSRASRAMLVTLLVMMASFDTLTWDFTLVLTVIPLAAGVLVPHEKRSLRPAKYDAGHLLERTKGEQRT
ncbi:MAG: O-antigen ligase family protein [Candidatus Binatia bacterium]